MNAGALDQRIVIERRTGATNDWGEPLPDSWLPIITTWAHVQPLTGRDFIAAQAAMSEVKLKIIMRYRPGITPADRVSHGGQVYGVEAVIDVHSSRRELHLMCKAVG